MRINKITKHVAREI